MVRAEVLEAETKVINVVLGVGGVLVTLAVPLVPGVADHAAVAAHGRILRHHQMQARPPGRIRRIPSRSTTLW